MASLRILLVGIVFFLMVATRTVAEEYPLANGSFETDDDWENLWRGNFPAEGAY